MKITKCENADNDPSWYAKSKQLLDDAASINTTNVSGFPINIAYENGGGKINQNPLAKAVPGIITLNINPSIGSYAGDTGVTGAATSAATLAAKNIYSYVRHANSGASNYESPDLMMAILAADQVFSAIAMGIRAYGVAMNYDQTNRYTPTALLRAMGFDPDSVINNMAQFRYYINNLISRASVIWVPSDMSIVNRHYWMYTNIYRDSEDSKAQYYMYTANTFYKFEPTTERTGSSLSVIKWLAAGNTHTIAEYYSMVMNMLDPIISDEDMGIMFGDMLKAYGSNNLFTINQIPDNYIILPVHNPEVMQQIHNSTCVPAEASAVKQRDGFIYNEYADMTRNNVKALFAPLNFWKHTPTPEEVMVATRLRAYVSSLTVTPDKNFKVGIGCGTEYVRSFTLWFYDANGELSAYGFKTFVDAKVISQAQLALISKFDWAPAVCTYEYSEGVNPDADIYNINAVFMDFDNYTDLSVSTLNKMNTTALFSEFGVPKSI